MENENKKPVEKFSVGLVQASVWKNRVKFDGVEKDLFSVSLQRSYKEKDGNWQSAKNLNPNDLPKAILVLQKAFEFVSLRAE